MRRKKLIKRILKISDGLLETLADFVLHEFFTTVSLLGKGRSPKGIYRAFWEADKLLQDFNYETIKQSLAYLKRKGLVRFAKEPAITAEGRKRLENILPVYDKKRVWDGSVYLVTYDVSEEKRYCRNKLRDFLEDLGAANFQKSVWLTVYNPEKLLKEFVKENHIEGDIVVSCVGKDGYIGEENLKQLLAKVFDLDSVNKRYLKYINSISATMRGINKTRVRFAFLSILADDPQLPFDFLPDDWAGDKAHRLYLKLKS